MVRKTGEAAPPWRAWYKSARWQRLREAQLSREPLCKYCLETGRTTEATVANHKIPHRGRPEFFWDPENLESSCAPHHDSTVQSAERGRPRVPVGADGWPIR